MTVLVYATACALLLAAAAMLHVVAHARDEARQFSTAFGDLMAPGLSDEEKERRARRAAIRAITGTGTLLLRLAAVAAAAAAPVLAADAAGLVPADAVARFALRLDVLAATTLVVAGAVYVVSRRRAGPARETGRDGL